LLNIQQILIHRPSHMRLLLRSRGNHQVAIIDLNVGRQNIR
jgi:hypothetical protein